MASTVVLARKYRPRSFADMVGQETTVKALSNALSHQRLHHAYLFTGTRGIGKTTVSRIFAKCLNCTGPDVQGGITATPCGRCDACTQIDEDRFIDYIELDAASNRGIGEVRDLLERAAYKPSVGRFKVFMIDESHQLTKESFNALLKTLEEPPEYVKFILATTDPQKMPATVLSRCLQFNLRPMAPGTVREHLGKVLAAEGIAVDQGSLELLGRAAQGSMRDALSLADQAIAFGGGSLKTEAVRAMLGSVGHEPVLAIIDALARRDARAMIDTVNALRDQGSSPEGTLESMAVLLQGIAIEQAAAGSLDSALPESAAMLELAAAMPAEDVQLLYSIVLHGRRELELAPDGYAGLTMVLLRLLAFPAAGREQPVADAGAARRAAGPVAPPVSRATQADSVPMAAAPVAASRAIRQADPPVPAAPLLRSAPPTARAIVDADPRDAHERAHEALAVPPDRPRRDVQGQAAGAHPDPRLADRWAEAVAQMQARQLIAAMVRELAAQSSLVAVDEAAVPPVWTLVVERDSLRTAPLQDKLAAALSQHLGAPQQLVLTAGQALDTPAQRDAVERERRAREAERVVHEDPLVQDMLAQFKTARIVPGSIQITQELKP